MKKETLISRIVLGFIYLAFGLDYLFLVYTLSTQSYRKGSRFQSRPSRGKLFFPMIKSIQIIGGLSMLMNRYAPFFAVVLLPISLNAFLYHTILVHSGSLWQFD
ncbi:MAG: DoxX family membrane protein [Bacteroidetes bacterium]|nr:DoxX family membrane protein [Bacteroidota bacterium]